MSGAGRSFGEMLRGGDKGKDKEKEGDEAKKDEAKPTGFSKTAEEWKRPVSVFASLKQAEKASDKGVSCLRMCLGIRIILIILMCLQAKTTMTMLKLRQKKMRVRTRPSGHMMMKTMWMTASTHS